MKLRWSSGDSELLMQGSQVRSLIRELRSHMLCGMAKKKKKRKEINTGNKDFTQERYFKQVFEPLTNVRQRRRREDITDEGNSLCKLSEV